MTPVLIIGIFNTLRKHFIISFPLDFASFAPIVIAVFRDIKHLAHAKNGKYLAMFVNKLEFYSWGCVKMLIW